MGLLDVLPIVGPAVLCVIADYVGLAAISPALPYHLNATIAPTPEELATWVGAITTAQFGAVILACIVWGRVCDVRGARLGLLLTMLGDSIFFSLTAAAHSPLALLLVRFGAGFFSPLVPALAYIFETVPPAQVVDGVAWYMLSVVSGLAIGSAAVSLYDVLGWTAFTLLVGGIAGATLIVASVTLKQRAAAQRKVKTEGVWRAVRSVDFLSTALTSFAVGYSLNNYLIVTAVMLFEMYQLSPSQTSTVFLCIPALLLLSNIFSPRIIRFLGNQRSITIFWSLGTVLCGLVALPSVHNQVATFLPVLLLHIMSMAIAHMVNQSRPGMIGAHYTKNGTGQLSGYSRVMFATGQALAPIVSLKLFTIHVRWAWLGEVALNTAVLVSYPIMGLSLWTDPAWRNAQIAASQAAKVPARVAADEPKSTSNACTVEP